VRQIASWQQRLTSMTRPPHGEHDLGSTWYTCGDLAPSQPNGRQLLSVAADLSGSRVILALRPRPGAASRRIGVKRYADGGRHRVRDRKLQNLVPGL